MIKIRIKILTVILGWSVAAHSGSADTYTNFLQEDQNQTPPPQTQPNQTPTTTTPSGNSGNSQNMTINLDPTTQSDSGTQNSNTWTLNTPLTTTPSGNSGNSQNMTISLDPATPTTSSGNQNSNTLTLKIPSTPTPTQATDSDSMQFVLNIDGSVAPANGTSSISLQSAPLVFFPPSITPTSSDFQIIENTFSNITEQISVIRQQIEQEKLKTGWNTYLTLLPPSTPSNQNQTNTQNPTQGSLQQKPIVQVITPSTFTLSSLHKTILTSFTTISTLFYDQETASSDTSRTNCYSLLKKSFAPYQETSTISTLTPTKSTTPNTAKQQTTTTQTTLNSQAFTQHSLPLAIYTYVAGQLIINLSQYCNMLTLDNYTTPEMITFIEKTLPQYDSIIETFENICKKEFSELKISNTPNASELENNYLSIRTNYTQKKAQLLIATISTLLQNLIKKYPVSAAKNSSLYQTSLQPSLADKYYQTLATVLDNVSNTKNNTAILGTFTSPIQALYSINDLMAELYTYAAYVYQNAAIYNCNLFNQPGKTTTVFNQTLMINHLNTAASLFSNAASYYASANKTITSQQYAQIGANLSQGSQLWQSALQNQASGNTGQAAQSFNQAISSFTNAGTTTLSFYMYQQLQQSLFTYNISTLASYTNYYQQQCATYIAQASTLPETLDNATLTATHNAFQSLFYPLTQEENPSALYNGLGWVSQLVVPSFKEILNGLQTLSSTADITQKEYLQQSLLILNNLLSASQLLFFGATDSNADASTKAADQNASSYTVLGVLAARDQYQTISRSFTMMDSVLTNQTSQTGLPFTGIFQGSAASQTKTSGQNSTPSIASWTQFAFLHQAHWTALNALQAIEYVDKCPNLQNFSQELFCSSVLNLLYSQMLYARLGFTQIATTLQTKLTALKNVTINKKTGIEILKNAAQNYQQKAAAFSQDLNNLPENHTTADLVANVKNFFTHSNAAIALYQAASLLGDSTAQQDFFTTLTLKESYCSNPRVANNTTSQLEGVKNALQWKLAVDQGWQQPPASSASPQITESATRLDTFLKGLTGYISGRENATEYQTAADVQALMVDFFNSYKDLMLWQENEYTLLAKKTLTSPYLTYTNVSSLPETYALVINGTTLKTTFTDPSYKLAELQRKAGQALFTNIQSGNTPATAQNFNAITSLYDQASSFFSSIGDQNQVYTTETYKTIASALFYYTFVMPSDTVRNIQVDNFAIQLANTLQGNLTGATWNVTIQLPQTATVATFQSNLTLALNGNSSQNTPTATTIPKLPTLEPLYLLRYNTINLSEVLAQYKKQVLTSQAVTKATSLKVTNAPPSDVTENEHQLLDQIETLATECAGHNTSESAFTEKIVDGVLVPLYQIKLKKGNYSGLLDFNKKVEQYREQVYTLLQPGMTINGTTYTSTYTVMATTPTGSTKPTLTIESEYVPLDAIPGFTTDTETALTYYSMYKKFFDTTQSTVTLYGNVYTTISNPNNFSNANKQIQKSYLAAALEYTHLINSYLKNIKTPNGIPLPKATFADKGSMQFKDYQQQYQAVTRAFTWIIGLLDALAQEATSLTETFVDINSHKYNVYTQAATVCGYFMMGAPDSADFQSVLKDAANNFFTATNYTQDALKNATSQQMLAQLYEAAGDYAITLQETMPQSDYLLTASTQFPSAEILTASRKLITTIIKKEKNTCPPVLANPIYPYDQPLSWYKYTQASAYYQQAYTNYTNALSTITNATQTSSSLSLANTLTTEKWRTYGKFFYYSLMSGVQTLSLFSRNAFILFYSQGFQAYVAGFYTKFTDMIKQGSTQGASTDAAGYDALTGTTSSTNATTDFNATQDYNLVKSTLLKAIIYITGVQGALNTLLETLNIPNSVKATTATNTNSAKAKQKMTIKSPLSIRYGEAIQCATSQYIPGLLMLIGGTGQTFHNSTVDTFSPLAQVEPYLISLNQLVTPSKFLCLQTGAFPSAMQAITQNLIGSPPSFMSSTSSTQESSQTNIPPFAQPVTTDKYSYPALQAFSLFVGDLFNISRDIYGQIFLGGVKNNDIQGYENSINSAISAQQQLMILNPASYIG